MVAKVFISQAAIDAWVASGEADLRDSDLLLRSNSVRLGLVPASLFMSVSGGEVDAHQLIGKVKDHATLTAMKAEVYMSSVLLGETAYVVEPGFLVVPGPGVDGGRLAAALRALGM
jgi:hypothetical protein